MIIRWFYTRNLDLSPKIIYISTSICIYSTYIVVERGNVLKGKVNISCITNVNPVKNKLEMHLTADFILMIILPSIHFASSAMKREKF